MEGHPPPSHGNQKNPTAVEQFKSEHQAEYERREAPDPRHKKVPPKTVAPRMKEVLRRRQSTSKTSALSNILYAEISRSGIYIYDPECRRCRNMMAKTRSKNKRSNTARVEKRRRPLYKLKKVDTNRYVGTVGGVGLQNLQIGAKSDMDIVDPMKSESKNALPYPDTSTSTIRTTSSMESDHQPMV